MNNIVQLNKTTDPQWEGFQHFYDPFQSAIIPSSQIQNRISENRSVKTQKYPLFKNKIESRKQSKQKITLPQICPHQEKSQQPETIPLKDQHLIRSITRKEKKYQRIPIVRYQDDVRYYGGIVYRGFVPRSSDNYLRLMKDVNFQEPPYKKTKNNSQLEFNSKFEGGNLNIVCRGCRFLI